MHRGDLLRSAYCVTRHQYTDYTESTEFHGFFKKINSVSIRVIREIRVQKNL